MKIGIDIDDVLAQFNQQWLNYYNQTYNTDYKFDDIKSYDFSKVYTDATGDEIFQRYFDFYKSPLFLEVLPVQGSQDGVKTLKSNELFVITSRNEDLKQTTLDWLNKYFPDSFNEVIFTNSFSINPNHKVRTKADVGKDLGLQFMVEDALSHAIDLAEEGIKVILLDKPWNRDFEPHDNILKAHSWKNVINLLEQD